MSHWVRPGNRERVNQSGGRTQAWLTVLWEGPAGGHRHVIETGARPTSAAPGKEFLFFRPGLGHPGREHVDPDSLFFRGQDRGRLFAGKNL